MGWGCGGGAEGRIPRGLHQVAAVGIKVAGGWIGIGWDRWGWFVIRTGAL